MSNCGCEGSCPICRIGEVDNHKCDFCKTEFCPECHGVVVKKIKSENVLPCECKSHQTKTYRERVSVRFFIFIRGINLGIL